MNSRTPLTRFVFSAFGPRTFVLCRCASSAMPLATGWGEEVSSFFDALGAGMPARTHRPEFNVAQLNRGPRSWQNVVGGDSASVWVPASSRHEEVGCVVSRLHVHSVTDTTNDGYISVVDSAFLAIERGARRGLWPLPSSVHELDAILSAVVDNMVFLDHATGAGQATKLLSAWSHIFPGMTEKMHLFTRAVAGSRRVLLANEGFGMSEERYGAIVADMFTHVRNSRDLEACTWVQLAKHIYGRSQDLEQLRKTPRDIAILHKTKGGYTIALFFGNRDRGEATKTEISLPNQGVTISDPFVAEQIKELWEKRHDGDPIFSVSRDFVWERVAAACDRLGIDRRDWGLHRFRHTGAANDLYHQRLTLLQIQRRGRWSSAESCKRYTKTAHLVADLAALPKHLRTLGEHFLRDPRAFYTKARLARVLFM